jgi:uncharacterized protein
MTRHAPLAVAAVAAVALLAASPTSAATNPSRPMGRLTVHGTGRVTGRPDLFTVQLGVETRAATASDALHDNSARATALVAVLHDHGVADKDVQTSQLSIEPVFDNRGRLVTGYQVDDVVTAKLRDTARAGALIDASAAAVGDAIRLQSVGFGIDDTGPLLAQARRQAVADARARAEQLAGAAGVHIAGVHSISESSPAAPQPVPFARAEAGAVAATPVEVGSQELTVAVDVVYDLS